MRRRGFSLVELMVASLLLSMLVTILTMIFNQSSIAWRTGTAGVAGLQKVRRQLGTFHDNRDSALPGLGEKDKTGKNRSATYRTVSVFKDDNTLRTDRAFDTIQNGDAPAVTVGDPQSVTLDSGTAGSGAAFTVGVRSAGPNGEFGDEDDITTWPDNVL